MIRFGRLRLYYGVGNFTTLRFVQDDTPRKES